MLDAIQSRRSIRRFSDKPVDDKAVEQILEAGAWAPSGLNNQPWRFAVIRDANLKGEMAKPTRYSDIIRGAPVCIVVFLDHDASYDRTKDVQAIGACIQNMLLTVHTVGLGGVCRVPSGLQPISRRSLFPKAR